MLLKLVKNPLTKKRLERFKEQKLAYYSLIILVCLYAVSLGSEFISNSVPLYVKFEGKSYYPVVKFYPEETFLQNGRKTRPDYKAISESPSFKENPDNYMVFTPLPFGPFESIEPESLEVSNSVTVNIVPVKKSGTVNIRPDFTISRSGGFGFFMGSKDSQVRGQSLSGYFKLPEELLDAINYRFENKASPPVEFKVSDKKGAEFKVYLSTYKPRKKSPKSVRLRFAEKENIGNDKYSIQFSDEGNISDPAPDIWNKFSAQDRGAILEKVSQRLDSPVDSIKLVLNGQKLKLFFEKEDIRFPHKPVKGHILGIDGAGRDVLSRILYGLRISLTFGLMLVFGSMVLGIVAGSLQGYYGGIVDISSQRFIEIWSALPFLYIMILMGSVYGRSFYLLLFCYGIFNWIGISYYVRAEFLKLRKQPFVEAAKCMGISPLKIMFRHIMPNALVPVITFFPFSLVGAIGSLAALDYLGFGLPPPTPSWGELLYQAQQYRWAWWLILYPSMALFTVMLLGVFVGEGIRNAYDPKRYTRLK